MNLLQLLNKTNKIKNKLIEKGREAVEQLTQDKPKQQNILDPAEQKIKALELKVEQRLLNIERRIDQLIALRTVDNKTVHSTNYIQLPKSKKPGYLQ